MIHTVAYELSASEAALTAITPVPDGTIAIQSTQIRVPASVNQIIAAAALINSATATLRAQIQAPSLRATLNYDIAPIVNGLVFGTIPRYLRLWNTPLQLQADEPVEDRKSTRLNSSHLVISYAVFCLKKKTEH